MAWRVESVSDVQQREWAVSMCMCICISPPLEPPSRPPIPALQMTKECQAWLPVLASSPPLASVSHTAAYTCLSCSLDSPHLLLSLLHPPLCLYVWVSISPLQIASSVPLSRLHIKGWILFHCICEKTFCLTVHLLRDTWVASVGWLLWVKLLGTGINKYLCKPFLSVIWGVYRQFSVSFFQELLYQFP